MRGESIICFAKDWTENPTSNHHVMRLLARDNDVLWLNSISMRTPNLAARRDLTTIGRKLVSFANGPVQVEPGLMVFTPIVLPFPHSSLAARINQKILSSSLTRLKRRKRMTDFQLWCFVPTAAPYAGRMGESLLVYYCADEWSQFHHVDGTRVSALERQLCAKADLVFTTSSQLLERKKIFNPETHLASHGVDYAHFAKALDDATPVAKELRDRSKPIAGFFGLLEKWVDIDLLAYLADRRPSWTIVAIGDPRVDVARLKRYPNVVLTGHRPYEELPHYCKAWNIALCPHVLSEFTNNMNPIKLREYLAAGLPVVSTGIPEMLQYPDWCYIASTPEDFLAACERALADDSSDRRRQRSNAMKTETWEAKVRTLCEHVLRIKSERAAKIREGVRQEHATQLATFQ
jgi:glycosyltransferase involved in cell wall biosynthesis